MSRTVSVSGADAVEAKSGGNFEVFAPGKFVATIIDVKEDVYKSVAHKGKPRLIVQFRIDDTPHEDGAGKNRRLKTFNIPLFPKWASGSIAFQFYQFFGALGVEFPEDGGDIDLPDDDDILGEQIGIFVKQEYSDKGVLQNVVDGYFDAGDGPSEYNPAPPKPPKDAPAAAGGTNDDFDL